MPYLSLMSSLHSLNPHFYHSPIPQKHMSIAFLQYGSNVCLHPTQQQKPQQQQFAEPNLTESY